MKSQILIETPRLLLERLDPEKHLEDFHELWNNDKSVIWSSTPAKKDLSESLEWFKFVLPSPENPDIDKFAFCLKDFTSKTDLGSEKSDENGRGKMIGMVGTNRLSPQGLEVGYCANIAYWGHGYTTEAFSAFLKYYWTLPERKGINKLVAKINPENKASRRVLEKCGARMGEVLPQIYERFVDGGVKSDALCFYFDRPVTEEGDVN